jgi:hypothetical protein
MTTPTPDEWKAVAEFVYPEFEWRYNITFGIKGFKYVTHGSSRYITEEVNFNPSLTGSDREQARACQTIVAATRLIAEGKLRGIEISYSKSMKSLDICIKPNLPDADMLIWSDILTASISAILSHLGAR